MPPARRSSPGIISSMQTSHGQGYNQSMARRPGSSPGSRLAAMPFTEAFVKAAAGPSPSARQALALQQQRRTQAVEGGPIESQGASHSSLRGSSAGCVSAGLGFSLGTTDMSGLGASNGQKGGETHGQALVWEWPLGSGPAVQMDICHATRAAMEHMLLQTEQKEDRGVGEQHTVHVTHLKARHGRGVDPTTFAASNTVNGSREHVSVLGWRGELGGKRGLSIEAVVCMRLAACVTHHSQSHGGDHHAAAALLPAVGRRCT